jgi:hypothetical protein
LSFELPGLLKIQAYSFVVVNAAIHEAWIRISRASYGPDLGGGVWLMKTEVTACCFINFKFIERALDKNGRPFACWLSAVLYDQATSNFAMRFRF